MTSACFVTVLIILLISSRMLAYNQTAIPALTFPFQDLCIEKLDKRTSLVWFPLTMNTKLSVIVTNNCTKTEEMIG